TVTVDGTPHNYTFDTVFTSAASMEWLQNSFLFVATGTSSTISFVSDMTGSSFAGAALDNVRVQLASPIADAWSGSAGNVYSGTPFSYPPLGPTICSGPGSNWNAAGSPTSFPLTVSSDGTQGAVVASYNVPV